MWGKGFLHSTQVRGGYIPEKQTDFIFTTIGEELGFAGAFLITVLYGFLLWRGTQIIAAADEDVLGKLIATGIVTMLAFHVIVNIGMNIGIVPVAGVPLPLISSGRQQHAAHTCRHRPAPKHRPPSPSTAVLVSFWLKISLRKGTTLLAMSPEPTSGKSDLPLPAALTTENTETAPVRGRGAGITPRALIIGILLIPIMCLWTEYTEIVAQATDIAAMSLIIAVVFVLFMLLLVNFGLKKYLPRWAFTQAELMYIYIMQTVSIGISGIGMMQFLNTFTGNIFYYGTPENKWKERFLPLVQPWLLPQESVTKAFYTGQSTFWRMDHIMGWIQPILVWSLFIVVLLWVMLCINVLIRRQWMDQERLSFPITQLPLEIARDGGSGVLFTQKQLWIGFADSRRAGVACQPELSLSRPFRFSPSSPPTRA